MSRGGSVGGAVEAIRGGLTAVIPTDTVYGLVADGRRQAPVEALYRLKRRPRAIPCALMAAELDAILDAVPELRGRAEVAARALLPGPYTLVLPNPARRFQWLCGETPQAVGIRVPELPAKARAVLERVSLVASTSANVHGARDPRTLDEVSMELREQVGATLDGGELSGTPSTVVDLTGHEPRIAREGAVPAEEALARARSALA